MAEKAEKSEKKQLAVAADKLYVTVANASRDEQSGARSKTFGQEQLMAHAGLESPKELMALVQYLTNENLFRTLRVEKKLVWSARPREAARQISALDRDEKLIYEVIEESHTQGTWARFVKQKTNITPNAVTKALAKMEKSMLIKSIKSVKNPLQKTYMLYHLVPSEDVTGNSFFDAGDLDESFRDELMNLIVFWVRQQSWADGKKTSRRRGPDSPILVAEDADSANKKRKRATDIEELPLGTKRRSLKFDPETDFTQLIFRAGSHKYPTAEDIHEFVITSDAIKATKGSTLTAQEIKGLLDVLVWDDKLEKVPNSEGSWGYRTVRGVTFKPPGAMYDEYEEHAGNGLTQAPCGRCPVFDLCHEDSPVNPAECVYFSKWLER
ncbi:DNA-directed RNA polymerase III subunit RPC6 [Lecanosticta acicola]|uniref:DNA-directed RNA polymerase III subunit RPC6 n=1 Tax=Lecanosticta acicola TaxID=111012 RepID=A0AAI8Z2L3_9PEZI|nr:DNA-directed RNA polymerase III subunit RPC6 [Lecanosticta acicola]